MARVVAITGGTGLVGRHLMARHVALGDEVRYLTRSADGAELPGTVRFVGDLHAPGGTLRSFVHGADVLYHCAAELRDASCMQATNVDGTRNLLKAAGGEVGRWVQLSSAGVYGAQREGVVVEDSMLRPGNDYERSKAAADALVLDAAARGLSCVLLRPSNVYGEDMPNQSLFQLIHMIDKGLFFFIGPRGASANYIHVDNVVTALMLCAQSRRARGRIYNLSDHRTMEAFVGSIAGHLGRRAPTVRLPGWLALGGARLLEKIPGMPLTVPRVRALTSRIRFPCDRIQRELGYKNEVGMEEGLLEMVKAWQQMKGK